MDTHEESGPPVTTEPGPVRTPIILVPPPLSMEQAEKLANAIKAVEELMESLGTVSWALGKFFFGKVLQGLKAMGPTPPLVPPGTQPPSTTP